MQDIINVNKKAILPLLCLVAVESFVTRLPILLALPFAAVHAVMLYTTTIAAVKEAKQKRQWFPTVLFRNFLTTSLITAAVAVWFDTLLAVVILIMGTVVYVMLGTNSRYRQKRPGNRAGIDEGVESDKIVRYIGNKGYSGSKTRFYNKRDIVDAEIVE